MLFVMVPPGSLPMQALDQTPSLRGRSQLITLWPRLITVARKHPLVPAKSSFWFGSTEPNEFQVPPVPPLPSSFGPTSPTSVGLADQDPFRWDLPPLPNHQRTRLGSQSSWLTPSNRSPTTITAWSYPTTQYENMIPNVSTPDLQTVSAVTRPISHYACLG